MKKETIPNDWVSWVREKGGLQPGAAEAKGEHSSFLLMYGEGKVLALMANATCRKEKALGEQGA